MTATTCAVCFARRAPAPGAPPAPWAAGAAVERVRRRARVAVAAFFFVNGALLASWVPHIPAVKASHRLSDGQLGLVLLAMAAGAVLALPLAGGLVARFGSRRVTAAAAIGFCLALPLPLASPAVVWLCLALLGLGAANATLDVAMNAQAILVERRYGRAIMASFHGLFSLGGVAGAAFAGLTMGLGVADRLHLPAVAAGGLVAVVAALPALLPSERGTAGGPAFARPSRALAGLGTLAFLGLLAEGAMADWSAVYLRDALATTPAVAAQGFAAFSLTMAAGRFVGDRVVARFGPARVLRASGAVAALGLALGLALGEPRAAILGFGLVGLGIANVVPILFSAAGRVRGGEAGMVLAAVATTGYLGLLAGPPLIGFAADLAGLPAALGLVSAAGAAIALGAAVLPDGGGPAPSDGAGSTCGRPGASAR